MDAPSPRAEVAPRVGPGARVSLRVWGVVLLVLFVLTSTVGGSLASESQYILLVLAGHIGLALVTLGVAGYATSFVGRRYPVVPRAFAGLAALSALGGTLAGTAYLLGGGGNAALYAMEGFASVGILAAAATIVTGGDPVRSSPAVSPP